jgi:hypothetical protein
VPYRTIGRPATLRRRLARLAIILAVTAPATLSWAAQRLNDSTTTSEPWECAQCRICKDEPKKVCGDTKTCSSYCAQLCVLCSQKSLTGGANGGANSGLSQRPKSNASP